MPSKKEAAAYESLRAEVAALTALDCRENYDSADNAAEGIVSEMEAIRDLTPDEVDDVAGLVTDWYYEDEKEDDEDDEDE